MHDRALRRLRVLIEAGRYVFTIHALDELAEDDLLAEEAINAVLIGSIVEVQSDRGTKEKKYVINGPDHAGNPVGVVMKIGATGKAVIVTVYREELP